MLLDLSFVVTLLLAGSVSSLSYPCAGPFWMRKQIVGSKLAVLVSAYDEIAPTDYSYLFDALETEGYSVAFLHWFPANQYLFEKVVPDLFEQYASCSSTDSEQQLVMMSDHVVQITSVSMISHGVAASFVLQRYLQNAPKLRNYSWQSLVILGHSLHINTSPEIPVLSLSGDLDGISRPFSFAVDMDREDYRHRISALADRNPCTSSNSTSSFVGEKVRDFILLKGLSHQSFATKPLAVFDALKDLKPEWPPSEGHAWIVKVVATFLKHRASNLSIWNGEDFLSQGDYQELLVATKRYSVPILHSLYVEANAAYLPECSFFSDKNPRGVDPKECFLGNVWSEKIQVFMSGMVSSFNGNLKSFVGQDVKDFETWRSLRVQPGRDGSNIFGDSDTTFTVLDSTHSAWVHFPLHLPTVKNNTACDGTVHCEVEMSLISEKVYRDSVYTRRTACLADRLEGTDIKNTPLLMSIPMVSASEIKAKMSSQQRAQSAAGRKNVTFAETDELGGPRGGVGQSLCAQSNRLALNYTVALLKFYNDAEQKYALPVSVRVDAILARAKTQLVFGTDIGPQNIGPIWIWNPPQKKYNKERNELTIRSSALMTPLEYSVSLAAGFHFCKLVSPAWILEWMTTDQLTLL